MWGTAEFQVATAGMKTDAEQVGSAVGGVFWVLVWLLALLKCVQIARRPATSAKAVYGLAFVFCGLAGCCVAQAVRVLAGPGRWFALVGLLPCLAFFLLGMFLAVLGLMQIDRARGQYKQGRAQAIWALVLGGLSLSLIGYGVLQGAGLLKNRPYRLAQDSAPPGRKLTFADYNFTFRMPARPWARLDAKQLNKASCLALTRTNPKRWFMIIAEDTGLKLTTAQLAEMVRANLRTGTGEATFSDVRDEELAGIPGTHMRAETTIGRQRVRYVYWVSSHNGFCFQLVMWSANADPVALGKDARAVFDGFRLIDPARTALAGRALTDDSVSARYGYTLGCKGGGWHRWTDMANDAPDADAGALSARGEMLMVVPVFLGGQDPHMDALAYALLQRMGIEFPNESITEFARAADEQGESYTFSYAREVNAVPFAYRIRTVKRGGYGYLVAAWRNAAAPPAARPLDEALATVTLHDAAGPPPAPADVNERERRVHAQVLNDAGIFYYESKRIANAIPYFAAALAFEPANKVFLSNVVRGYDELTRYAEALAFLDEHIARFREDPALRACRADLLQKLGRPAEAIAAYAQLFAGSYTDDDHFATYAELLADQDRPEDALAAVAAYLQRRDTPAVRRAQASIYAGMQQYDKAAQLLEACQARLPFHAGLQYDLADHYFNADLFDKAKRVCEGLIERGHDSAYAHYLKGRSEYELKWYPRAKASFEAALARDPKDAEIKDYLDHVSGMLGEGVNSALKEPIEPVPLPAELAAVPEPPAGAADYSAVYLRRMAAIRYEKEAVCRRTDYRLVQVLQPSGVAKFSTFQFNFDPLREAIYVNSLAVTGADGQPVAEGKVADYYIVDEAADLVTHRKTLNIPVPAVEAGRRIELVVTRRELSPPDRFPFVAQTLASQVPVACGAVFVCGETGAVKAACSAGVEAADLTDGRVWSVRNPVVYRWEPLLPWVQELLPTVYLGDRTQSWANEVARYHEDVGERLAPDQAAETLAAGLTAGLTNRTDKVRALVRHVQKEITYKGIEFGRRAWLPRAPATVLNDRFGDCKDHALLLHQLLRAVGEPSHLALVNAGEPVREDMPSLDQFNHMILFLPAFRGGLCVDCTDKESDLFLPVPYGMSKEPVLVLDPAMPRMRRLPAFRPEHCTVTCEREFTVADGADLDVRETVTLGGYYASHLRAELKDEEPANRQSTVQWKLSAESGPVEVRALEVENLDEPDRPLVLRLAYRLAGRFHVEDGRCSGRLPALWERYYLVPGYVDKRLFPFVVAYPLRFTSRVRLTLPAGWQAPREAGPDAAGETAHLRWRIARPAPASGEVGVSALIELKAGRFPAEQYAGYHKQLTDTIGALEGNVVLAGEK
ncbi:MAG: tetratricopeptide repeat protein [Kiritimatiellae bacterium]|nr:tetratricopeptide repeat protein [Kiritimatiellia bacterium]